MHAQIVIKNWLIIHLTLGIAIFAASMMGNPAIIDTADFKETSPVVVSKEVAGVKETLTTKDKVKEYFKEVPILAEVARCESEYRQFNSDGSVLRGDHNKQDVGVMQINEKYHLSTSQKLGLNIHTLEGNMAYAKYLYETQGTRPWEYSSKCWGKTREIALH